MSARTQQDGDGDAHRPRTALPRCGCVPRFLVTSGHPELVIYGMDPDTSFTTRESFAPLMADDRAQLRATYTVSALGGPGRALGGSIELAGSQQVAPPVALDAVHARPRDSCRIQVERTRSAARRCSSDRGLASVLLRDPGEEQASSAEARPPISCPIDPMKIDRLDRNPRRCFASRPERGATSSGVNLGATTGWQSQPKKAPDRPVHDRQVTKRGERGELGRSDVTRGD